MRNRDNYIVSFRYHPIDPYDVAFPGKTVTVGCGVADDISRLAKREALLEECKQLNVQGRHSIVNRWAKFGIFKQMIIRILESRDKRS